MSLTLEDRESDANFPEQSAVITVDKACRRSEAPARMEIEGELSSDEENRHSLLADRGKIDEKDAGTVLLCEGRFATKPEYFMGAGKVKAVFSGVDLHSPLPHTRVAIKLSAPGAADADANVECDMVDAIGEHANIAARLFKAIGERDAVRVSRDIFSDAVQSELGKKLNTSGSYAPLTDGLLAVGATVAPTEFVRCNLVVEELGALGELIDILLAARGDAAATAALERATPYLFAQVAGALSHMHGDGATHRAIAHGDVKSQNICVTQGMRVLLIDYGSVHMVAATSSQGGGDPRAVTMVNAAGMDSTPEYTSPEKSKGGIFNPFLNDVYSAGLVLFEMCSLWIPGTAGLRRATAEQVGVFFFFVFFFFPRTVDI